MDARSAVVQQCTDLLYGEIQSGLAHGFRAAPGVGFLKGEIELAGRAGEE